MIFISGNSSGTFEKPLRITSIISFLMIPSPLRRLPTFSPLRNVSIRPVRSPVLAVAAFPLPRLERVVLHPIQPAADQRVADLDLVVEERERQFGVERFDPERHTGQFHRQRVDVHAVDAPLDNVPPQQGLDPLGKRVASLRVVRRERDQFLLCLPGPQTPVGQREFLGLLGVIQVSVVAERLVECVGQVVQSGDEERRTSTRRVADLEPQDRLRLLGRERAVSRLVIAKRLQGPVDRGHRQLRAGVERARPLAGVPRPHEVELAGGDHPLDQPVRFGLDPVLVLAVGLLLARCLPTRPARTTASLAHRFADSTASR